MANFTTNLKNVNKKWGIVEAHHVLRSFVQNFVYNIKRPGKDTFKSHARNWFGFSCAAEMYTYAQAWIDYIIITIITTANSSNNSNRVNKLLLNMEHCYVTYA